MPHGEENAALTVLVLCDASPELKTNAAQPGKLTAELGTAVVLVSAMEGKDDLRK